MDKPDYHNVLSALRRYRDARQLGQFHNPKDLAVAVAVESAELLEHFLWRSDGASKEQSSAEKAELGAEIADIAIYLAFLCDALGLDLLTEMDTKRAFNERRHPISTSVGKSRPSL